MWVRAGMFATIIILVALILITPTLLGHPSELSTLPILIVAMTPDLKQIVVDVTSVQAYLYDNITLRINDLAANNTTVPGGFYAQNNTFSAAVHVPSNRTALYIHVRLVDRQQNFFEGNVTMTLSKDSNNQAIMTFGFPTEPNSGTIARAPPGEDFRWAVPRRGMLP